MAARTQAARQLTYYAARQKDSGKRCELEAGMAKLLATRAAWEAPRATGLIGRPPSSCAPATLAGAHRRVRRGE
jgi:hypothetical protein